VRQQTSNCSLLLIYRPRRDERLSWPDWLTYSGWLTHISGHPSATGRAQDSESMPAKDRRSTAGPRNHNKAIVDYNRAVHPRHSFLPIGDAAYRQHAGLRLSHGHRQHAQKIGNDRACGSGDILADRQTHKQT